MKMNWLKAAALVALFAGASLTLAAGEATLKIGDKAPALQVSRWLQGEPVTTFSKGTAYVVEFWATWCPPCRASIPHLNELHLKFKDKKLVVIGQDVKEHDITKVVPFIKQMGDKMTYRVALDDMSTVEQGAMDKTWMEAAGQTGIPTAFLINTEGRIAWIGHPMTLREETIQQVLDGTYDVQKAAQEQKNQSRLKELTMQFGSAMQAQKWDAAEATLTELAKIFPADNADALTMARAQIAFGRKDYKGGYTLIEQVADRQKDNPIMQRDIARYIATDEKLAERDLKLADKLITRALKAGDGKGAATLDTQARIQFLNGDKKAAIATMEKALKLAGGDDKEQFQQNLNAYKAGKLPKVE
jgi:thiol-disulfide isomerase/thioredoxin